jgi:hypothetical protein
MSWRYTETVHLLIRQRKRTTTMDNKFENLETLRKAAWESIAARRKYEWQVSISFWGLLGSFMATLVLHKDEIAGYGGLWGLLSLLLVPVLLCVAHCWWLVGLFHAYTIDKKDEEDLRNAMHSQICFNSTTADMRSNVRKKREQGSFGSLRNWNTRSQIITTVALGILAFYIVLWVSCEKKESKSATEPTPTAVTLPATKQAPLQ